MKNFKHEYGIELDAVYTGKMFCGLFDLIENNYFEPGTRIVAIHTGGLQGNLSFKNLKSFHRRDAEEKQKLQ